MERKQPKQAQVVVNQCLTHCLFDCYLSSIPVAIINNLKGRLVALHSPSTYELDLKCLAGDCQITHWKEKRLTEIWMAQVVNKVYCCKYRTASACY